MTMNQQFSTIDELKGKKFSKILHQIFAIQKTLPIFAFPLGQ